MNPDASLGDLGLDSMMSVEVKQTLERGFDLVMATREIRQLTVNKLREISEKSANASKNIDTAVTSETINHQDDSQPTLQVFSQLMPNDVIIRLNKCDHATEPLYIIHPIEGMLYVGNSVFIYFRPFVNTYLIMLTCCFLSILNLPETVRVN